MLAEGAVIVVSILLAFAIDAWWDSVQDRSREASYLAQLAADLEGTLINNERFHGFADRGDRANASLVGSHYQADPPPYDSLAIWIDLSFRHSVVQPRLETARALVSTGDLALIRDDSLRAAIAQYVTTMEAFEGFEADGEKRLVAGVDQLSAYIDPFRYRLETVAAVERDSIAGLDEQYPMYPLPAGRLRTLPPVDLLETVRSPEVRHVLVQMFRARRAMRTNRNRMRNASEGLLEQVRAVQAGE